MARKCTLTGKGVLTGNNVSHANNKTRRRFLPNLQNISFSSEALGVNVSMRLTANAIKTVDRAGGLDAYLLGQNDSKLPNDALKIKKRIVRALENRAA